MKCELVVPKKKEGSLGGRVFTSGLCKEGDDISSDEHFGEPLYSDRGVRFAIRQNDYSSKDHVYRSCEEGWR